MVATVPSVSLFGERLLQTDVDFDEDAGNRAPGRHRQDARQPVHHLPPFSADHRSAP